MAESRGARGCHTCKTRKIKCDLAEPVCQRCARARRTCVPSSATSQALTIHSENNFVAGQTRRPRGPRSTYARPSVALEELALAYFFQHHVHITASAHEPNLGGDWSRCISYYKASGRSCGILDLAFLALSLVIYGRIHRCCRAAKMGTGKYTELLKLMHTKMQPALLPLQAGASRANIDGDLLTIFLMCRYETTVTGMNFIQGDDGLPGPFAVWLHHDGALAFLKSRYSDLGMSAEERENPCIIKASRRGLLRCHFLRSRVVPDWLLRGERFGERGSGLAYDKIFVRLANLRKAVTELEQQQQQHQHDDSACTFSVARVEELDREGLAVRSGLRTWRDEFLLSGDGGNNSVDGYQRAIVVGGGPWRRPHFYSSTFYLYDSLTEASRWLNYFATSMLAIDISVRVLQLLQPGFDGKSHLLTQHPDMADFCEGFAATIPFCLERAVKVQTTPAATDLRVVESKEPMRPYLAWVVGWPMTIAATLLNCLDDSLQRWARQELAEIGKMIGDGGLVAAAAVAAAAADTRAS